MMDKHPYDSTFEHHTIRLSKWSLSISIVTVIGLAISLYYVNDQLRQNGEGIATSNYVAATNWNVEFDKVFIEHPELYPYFQEGKEAGHADDTLRQRLLSTAELAMDTLDSMLANSGDTWPDPGFQHWAHDLFSKSPLLRQHLVERRSWYCRHLYPEYSAWARAHRLAAPEQPRC